MACLVVLFGQGVYRLAKEFQQTHPEKKLLIFFIGIGVFYMEKIMIACCGKYLEERGISSVLVANEIFGPQVVMSVMEGSYYVQGKLGMVIIAKSMIHLQLSTAFNAIDTNNYGDLFVRLTQLNYLFRAGDPNFDLISVAWARLEDEIANLLANLENFRITGSLRSPLFEY